MGEFIFRFVRLKYKFHKFNDKFTQKIVGIRDKARCITCIRCRKRRCFVVLKPYARAHFSYVLVVRILIKCGLKKPRLAELVALFQL